MKMARLSTLFCLLAAAQPLMAQPTPQLPAGMPRPRPRQGPPINLVETLDARTGKLLHAVKIVENLHLSSGPYGLLTTATGIATYDVNSGKKVGERSGRFDGVRWEGNDLLVADNDSPTFWAAPGLAPLWSSPKKPVHLALATRKVAVVYDDKSVTAYNLKSGQPSWSEKPFLSHSSLKATPLGILYAVDSQHKIELRKFATGQVSLKIAVPPKVRRTLVDGTGPTLVADNDGDLVGYDWKSGKARWHFKEPVRSAGTRNLGGNVYLVHGGDGSWLGVNSLTGKKLWTIEPGLFFPRNSDKTLLLVHPFTHGDNRGKALLMAYDIQTGKRRWTRLIAGNDFNVESERVHVCCAAPSVAETDSAVKELMK